MAKVIKKRIRIQSGKTVFVMDTNYPIIVLEDEWLCGNVRGKTFFFKTIQTAVSNKVGGYDRKFICCNSRTDTRKSLLEKICTASNKFFIIDDFDKICREVPEDEDSYADKIIEKIKATENQYLIISNDFMGARFARACLSREGDILKMEVFHRG